MIHFVLNLDLVRPKYGSKLQDIKNGPSMRPWYGGNFFRVSKKTYVYLKKTYVL